LIKTCPALLTFDDLKSRVADGSIDTALVRLLTFRPPPDGQAFSC
jgi:hypothetical protein